MNYKKWLLKNTASLEGKTVAISGATGGLGRELCRYFCQLSASLILIDRNAKRSASLREQLLAEKPDAQIKSYILDLEDTSAARKTAAALLCEDIDYLVLNAGAYKIPRHKCENGFDNVFNINFVSPYILARALLPKISERGGRVVAVGSIAHNYSRIDVADVDFSTRRASSKAYGNAKRYLMYSLWGLEEYSSSVAIAHPGIAVTNITAHFPKPLYALMKYPMKLIFMKPRKACLSILLSLFEDTEQNEWIGPRVFDVWGLPKKKKLKTCSKEEAEQISKIAKEIYLK